MTRLHLEHIIRAAGAIAGDDEIIIIGSQAILGQFPDAPAPLLFSVEADVFPKNHVERSELIDASIGEGSPFEKAFGYFAHGVEEATAILAPGWRERLVPVRNENTRGVTGWCLEVHDLALAKYAAGREKDLDYTHELIRAGYVDKRVLLDRVESLPVTDSHRKIIRGRIAGDFQRGKRGPA